jgi:uncharacterized membrane protein (DUF441 family)
MEIGTILASPLAVALIGYVILVTALALAAHPMRIRMVELVEDILAEPQWNAAERLRLNQLLDTCMSFRVGLMVVVAALSVIVDVALGRVEEPPASTARLRKDARYHSIVVRYFVSVLAANPIAAVAAVPLMIMALIAEQMIGGTMRAAVEEAALKASASLPKTKIPC